LTAVSAKTDFLLVGKLLEDGREATTSNKYKNAVEKKVTILTEEEFLAKIQSSNPSNKVSFAPLLYASFVWSIFYLQVVFIAPL
jgi:hypothetical protein